MAAVEVAAVEVAGAIDFMQQAKRTVEIIHLSRIKGSHRHVRLPLPGSLST